MTEKLNPGIIKMCSGLLEGCTTEPYFTNIYLAERVIGCSYRLTWEDELERQKMVAIIKKNLINRKENSFEFLKRHYDIEFNKNILTKERDRFCYELASLCGFL